MFCSAFLQPLGTHVTFVTNTMGLSPLAAGKATNFKDESQEAALLPPAPRATGSIGHSEQAEGFCLGWEEFPPDGEVLLRPVKGWHSRICRSSGVWILHDGAPFRERTRLHWLEESGWFPGGGRCEQSFERQWEWVRRTEAGGHLGGRPH